MLEDEFVDVLRKAMRGTKLDAAALAERSGATTAEISGWTSGTAVPSDAQAAALARALALEPAKFADSAAVRWHPEVALPLHVRQHLQLSTPHSNGYLLLAESDGTAALVDPAGDPQTLLEAIEAEGYALRYILVTHRHADHCESAAAVHRTHPEAEIVVSEIDAGGLGELAATATKLSGGETLPFGDGTIRTIATAGHTDGSLCFLAGDVLFTGDTLFAGSVGGAFGDRTGYADILANVRGKLLSLDPGVVVMPGHGPPSSIAGELAHNPFFG